MLMKTFEQAKRVTRVVLGFTLLVLGVALLVLPGPGIVTIVVALAILATEFVWARRLLDRFKDKARAARDAIGRRRAS